MLVKYYLVYYPYLDLDPIALACKTRRKIEKEILIDFPLDLIVDRIFVER